jgi:GT2 family glycosyltransferase
MTKDIAVVILNWNGKKFLEKFLDNVISNSPQAEVIVADNNSSDDSVSFLQKNYPDIRLIINSENGGYAKGYNDSLKQVESKYYVLLNSDIEVSKNWLQPLYELLESDNQIAASQPKLICYDDKSKFEYAGASGGFIDKYGYPFCRGRIFNSLEDDNGQYDDIREVFWATGAALFVRSNAFWEVGGLDEDFFAHMEEIDLCWRLKNNKYKIMINPKSEVYHVGGGTLPKNSPFKTYLNFRNNLLTIQKNLPKSKFRKLLFIKLFLDGIAGLKFLFEGSYKDTFAVAKAHFGFYKMSKQNAKKRANNIHQKPSAMYDKSIVTEYYLKGKKTFDQLDESIFNN